MSNFEDDERFDGLYLNVAQTTRGIEPLLDSVFSFLRRKTDFFAGPPGADGPDGQAAAIAKVNEVLEKHANRYQEDIIAKKNKKKVKQQKQQTSKKAKSTTTTKPTTTTVKQPFKITEPEDEEEIIEMGTDGEFDASTTPTTSQKPVISPLGKSSTTVKPPKKEPSKKEIPMKTDAAKDDDDDDGDKEETKKETGDDDGDDGENNDGPPPAGNGGTVPDKYVWTQTLAECIVTIPVPENTRGRDVQVTMSRSHLKVSLKNKQQVLIVDDDFTKPIICDDSFWTIEDSNRLVINLQKLNQMEWWNSICKSDPIINVRQIRPENSNLGDLDGETRKTVEKMMFDQRQKGMSSYVFVICTSSLFFLSLLLPQKLIYCDYSFLVIPSS